MTGAQALVKTLDFQLDIQSDNESLLYDATLEARSVYNETIRLAKQGVDWDTIPDRVADDANLVKNTTQRVVAKALGAMENYYEYDDFGQPSHTKEGAYPLRANYEEGYNLSITDDGDVAFRISAKPYNHVKGILKGDDAHLDILKTALESDEWKIGTAEALFHNDTPELHVNVTNTGQTVRDKHDSRTVVGVDVNEDNVALTALSEVGVEDTLVIDFPEIKFERHRYFTMRKRVQNAEKESTHDTLKGREERFVHDRLHKVSRHIVEWSQQFEKPCIVFEDLKEMRDSIDYGTRMNRRLHHLPFRALQFYTSYKASFEGIPTGWIDPYKTSQRCPMCGHAERANRNKKRFKCKDCGSQDHSDRSASVNIAVKGIKKHQNWNVPALNSLPQVRKVRRRASGAVDAPTVTHDTATGHLADGVAGVSD
ncbi:IS200/IS605 family element transposase accessory protein TnpB [Halorubrum sp. CBA1125]|uniref:RNA-guided endonuclease InsQ/TnpB family protein n=1 Tax=Halorubrum sp. CBA1125 TaxID=2668072 RepID=UPI0012E946B0|nr:RNA-guided endonuclease TnpB family protein [Halorubrum sp. CBA1125]MUW15263.1 IS200/IS605 family element transposase accessory protein TnpB [Halorubrum sp. CBA1125]